MLRCLSSLTLALCLAGGLPWGAAQAQMPEAPPSLFKSTRREAGDSLRVCIDSFSAGAALDRAVAQAIGAALLLKVEIGPGLSNFPLNGDGYLTELRLLMTNDCDVMMGMSAQSNPAYGDWAVLTRPYASIPFVAAVADPAFDSLEEVPFDRRIGTALGSKVEWAYLTWAGQQPKDRQWVRLPYADPALMLRRLRDGSLGAILIWQPALQRALAEGAAVEGGDARPIATVPLSPLRETVVDVSALVSGRNSFLRVQLDEAIAALQADGTLDGLMAAQGITGHAP